MFHVCVLLDRQPTVSDTRNKMESQSSRKKLVSLWVKQQAVTIIQFMCGSFLGTLLGFKLTIPFKLVKENHSRYF